MINEVAVAAGDSDTLGGCSRPAEGIALGELGARDMAVSSGGFAALAADVLAEDPSAKRLRYEMKLLVGAGCGA